MKFVEQWSTLSRRTKLAAMWICGLLAVWILGGFLLVPYIARGIVEEQIGMALQRNCTVGGMAFNPLTLSVEMRDTKVQRKDGKGEFIAFSSVKAAPDIISLFYMAPVVRYISIQDLAVSADFLGKGRYSFSDLLESGEDSSKKADAGNAIFPFAVRNFMLTNSSLVLNDLTRKQTHTITDLNLQVPFTSSLASDRDDPVEPRLNATLNGDPLNFKGRIVPFGDKFRTDFVFEASGIKLADYWEYLPVKTPLALSSGNLSTAVNLSFEEQASGAALRVSGNGTVTNLALADGKKKVFGFESFSYDIGRVSLLEQLIYVRRVMLQKPYVAVTRGEDGVTNWQRYFPQSVRKQPEPSAVTVVGQSNSTAPVATVASVASSKADTAKGRNNPAESMLDALPYIIRVDAAVVDDAKIDVRDNAVAGGFAHVFGPLDIRVRDVNTSGGNGTVAVSMHSVGELSLEGAFGLKPAEAALKAKLSGADLKLFAPYIHEAQPLLLDSGVLGLTAAVDIRMRNTLGVELKDAALTLNNLELRKDGNRTASIRVPELKVQGVYASLAGRNAGIKSVDLNDGFVRLVREKNGSIDLQRLFAESASAAGNGSEEQDKEESAAGNEQSAPWQFLLERASLNNSEVIILDETLPRTGRLGLTKLTASVTNVSSALDKPVAFDVKGSWLPYGTVAASGSVVLDPLQVDVKTSTRRLGLPAFDPYLAVFSDLVLAKGGVDSDLTLSMRGTQPEGIRASGSVAVRDVLVRDAIHKDGLASLGALRINGVAFDGAAKTLQAESVTVQEPRLDVLRNKDGVLNVQRALRQQPAGPAANATASADASIALSGVPEDISSYVMSDVAASAGGAEQSVQSGEGETVATVEPKQSQEGRVDMSVSVNATIPGAPKGGDEAGEPAGLEKLFTDVRLGGFGLTDGAVNFKDVSVTPPFELQLSGVNATLSAVSLTEASRPDLGLRGRLNGAPLSLNGALNPLVAPPYSDLDLRVANLDLVAFTPYSLQGIAYPVKRGRLDVSSKFKTENWLLTSDTKLHIERLALGEKDKRPGAPSYPVELGIALLRGPSGDIDISLPVRGRLDDPNFRVGGIVLQAVVNIMMKALTSPFALLGGLFGGGENLDFVAMQPGIARLDDVALEEIKSISKALVERPGLELEMQGQADAVRDRQALEKAAFDLRIKTQKYLDLPRKERAELSPESVTVAPEEYEQYLWEAYKEEPSDDPEAKPTALFGIVKEQAVEFMEAFLRRQTAVSDDDLRAFALERSKVVQQAILALQPSVADRLFLVQPVITGQQGGKAASATGVSLTLR
ncbi:DUF748 domain-containing protein [Oleidesulfovibrio sp.]|uniref:DUF748 domain-containing protein n=1 Tax=Oleidesulfovibrio sp. TaxID=2909707 RepID=UPI003A88954B